MSRGVAIAANVLDELAFAAFQAHYERVERSQVNKLLECLESTDSFTLLVFLARQVARGQWSRVRSFNSAARLFRVLKDIASKAGSEAERRSILRKALGYFKWFYECGAMGARQVDSVLRRKLGQAYIQALNNPNAPAPPNFAEEYLKALLRVS